MAKLTVYECDGLTDANLACESYEECEPGSFPAGWLTLTVEARIHGATRAPGGRGRDRKYEERPDGADWLHLCPNCAHTREGEARLAAVVAKARIRKLRLPGGEHEHD